MRVADLLRKGGLLYSERPAGLLRKGGRFSPKNAYNRTNVYIAYLHAAYLMANIRTGYMYSFSRAGKVFRKLLLEGNCSQLGACVIPADISLVDSIPWLAEIEEPNNLRCLWIKVAGNIVIFPQPDNTELTALYDVWQQASTSTDFGLKPKGTIHFKLKFFTKRDLYEAKKCLPTYFNNIPP
jgi:hypothetical protein